MSNELVPASSGAIAATAPVPVPEVEVTAESGDEMQQCQEALIQWARRKVKEAERQATELDGAYLHAVKRKWKSDTLKRHAALAGKRFEFYTKFLLALEAGYQIVPSFPVTLFAIRTDKKKPKAKYATYHYVDTHEQDAKELPAGEGKYQNPFPVVRQNCISAATAEKRAQFGYWADRWDEFEFPLSMAKPKIMKATSRAMALKIFDEIGICPEDPKRQDPMIIGKIFIPMSTGYDRRRLSFIIAWHLNTGTI